MKNFILGLMVGVAFAVCGYRPYQIEMEYRQNIRRAGSPHGALLHRYDSLRPFHMLTVNG
jgi:hypothetical protein